MSEDTIAAIATAPGQAGIAVVRVSGPDALRVADGVFRCPAPPPSQREANTFVRGFVRGEATAPDIDEAILLIYRAPHSYTREDVVELQGHGGAVSAPRILRATLHSGARMAEPGEFTKRAFLNGRIDLLQAEAVGDLIRAQSNRAAIVAVEQLEGALSNCILELYNHVISTLSDVEHVLDFEEGELPETIIPALLAQVKQARIKNEYLLTTQQEGRLIRDGALVVISGQPNVGKSTLLNQLVGTARAIVAPSPGTTRDTIEEQILINGIPVRLVDTAGLRETGCEIEQEGVRRAHVQIDRADINLHVIDASRSLDTDERRRLIALKGKTAILVLNKRDLGCCVEDADLAGCHRVVHTSVISGDGIEGIRAELAAALDVPAVHESRAVISERHRIALETARDGLAEAQSILDRKHDEDLVLVAEQLRIALEALGEVTGRHYTDELLEAVFSRFCVGK